LALLPPPPWLLLASASFVAEGSCVGSGEDSGEGFDVANWTTLTDTAAAETSVVAASAVATEVTLSVAAAEVNAKRPTRRRGLYCCTVYNKNLGEGRGNNGKSRAGIGFAFEGNG
jgi:hypothetical protein